MLFSIPKTSDVDIMKLAWGVDIDPVIAMVSMAFGRHCISLLNVSLFFFLRVLPLLLLALPLKLLSRLITLYYRFLFAFLLININLFTRLLSF